MDHISPEQDKQSEIQFIDEIDENEWLQEFEEFPDESHSPFGESDFKTGEDHYEVIDTSMPRIGMEFPNSDIAYEFYRNFALRQGFATRKYSSGKWKKDGIVVKRYFVCNKEGFKRADKREIGRQNVRRRRETREFCKAHMNVHLINGKWCIRSFYNTHTHPMIVSPRKKVHLRSQISYVTKNKPRQL